MPKNHMSHYIQPHGRHKGRPLEWLIFAELSYALRIRRQLPGDHALQEAFDAIEEYLVADRVVLSCDFCGTNQAAFTVVPSTWNAYLWKKSRFWCGDCYRPHGWDKKTSFELSLAGAERLVRVGARRADTKGFGRLLGLAFGVLGSGVGNLTEARALEFFHGDDSDVSV
jgi:hypothetical protein